MHCAVAMPDRRSTCEALFSHKICHPPSATNIVTGSSQACMHMVPLCNANTMIAIRFVLPTS